MYAGTLLKPIRKEEIFIKYSPRNTPSCGLILTFAWVGETFLSVGYEITVSTVDEFLAGTDARVFIEMYGGNAEKTGWIELSDDGKNVFEAGA